MFKTVIPLNIPPKLKNGRLLYKKMLTGFFKINDKINIAKIPTNDTRDLVNPLNPPSNPPKTINIKIIKSTTFTLPPIIIILYFI